MDINTLETVIKRLGDLQASWVEKKQNSDEQLLEFWNALLDVKMDLMAAKNEEQQKLDDWTDREAERHNKEVA